MATVALPGTIDATGATDVSAAIASFIESQPAGTHVCLGGSTKTYRVDGAIKLGGLTNIEIDGRTTSGTGGSAHVVCHGTGFNENFSAFYFQTFPGTNSGVSVHDVDLVGSAPTPGVFTAGKEGQHGILCDGGTGFDLYNLTVSAVWGDAVEFNSGCTLSKVHDSTFTTPCRMGVSVIWGDHLTIGPNLNITHPGYMPFDIEPNASSSGPCFNIEIFGNTTAFWSNAWMAINGSQTTYAIHDISVHDNVSTGKSLLTIVNPGSAERLSNISFVSNRTNVSASGPVFQFFATDGVVVQHNIQPLSSGALVSTSGSTGPGGGAPLITPNNDTGAVLAGTSVLSMVASGGLGLLGLSGLAAIFVSAAADLGAGGPGSGGGVGTTSLVHSTDGSSASAASLPITIPLPTLGNTLIVVVGNTAGAASIASGQGGVTTWGSVLGGFWEELDVFYGVVDGTPSTSVTITLPTGRVVAKVMEWAGHLALDQQHAANGSSATIDGGSVTPTHANEVVIAAGLVFQTISSGPTGGFTDRTTVASATFSLGVGSLIETTAVAADASWGAPSSAWDGVIFSFNVVGGGGVAGAALAGTSVLAMGVTSTLAPLGAQLVGAVGLAIAVSAAISGIPVITPSSQLRAAIIPNTGAALNAPEAYPLLAYTKLTITQQFWGGDSFLMLIGGASKGASSLALGQLLWLPDEANSVFLIEQIQTDKSGASKANSQLTVSGRSVDGFFGAERLIIPAAGVDYDEQAGLASETAIKHYVRNQAGINAVAARQIPSLIVASDLGRGDVVTIDARYQTLADVLLQIGMLAGIGWNVTIDPSTGSLVFDVVIPTDRSASVFFDFDFGTITNWEDINSILSSSTLALVAGQGDLAARDVELRFQGTEPTGFDRREAFIDARDVAQGDLATLDARGDAYLAANAPTRSVNATIFQFGSFRPGRDWFLGDLVLLHDPASGVNEVDRVVKIVKTYDISAAAPTIVASVGKPFPGADPTLAAPSGAAADAGVSAGAVATTVGQVIADLSVGGANLVKNSSFESGIAGTWVADPAWNVPYTSFGIFGVNSARIQLAAQTAGDLVVAAKIAVSPLDDYWISFWSFLQAYSIGIARFEVREYDAIGTLLATTPIDVTAVELIPTRHSVHFGPDNTTPSRIAWQPTTAQIAVAFYTPTSATLTWQVDGVQVERGAIMTAYAPAPQELIDAQIGPTQIADNAITTQKIIAGAIDTGRLAAGAITADKLAATLILASLIKTADAGARLELDAAGLRAYSSSGDILVNVPTDGVSPVAVSGQVRATSLLVPGPAELDGANVLAKASTTTLAAGVLPPTVAPVLSAGWATQALAVPTPPVGYTLVAGGMTGGYYDAAGGASGATPCYVALATFSAPLGPGGSTVFAYQMIEWKIADGTIDRTTTVTGLTMTTPANMQWFGVTRIGANWFVAGTELAGAVVTGRVSKVVRATGVQTTAGNRTTGSPIFRDIKTDGAVLFVLDQANSAVQTWTTSPVFSATKTLTGVAASFTDLEYDGTLWWVGTQSGATVRAYAFTPATGAVVANRDFGLAPGAQPRGLFWDGANFKSVPYVNAAVSPQVLYTHTAWDWTTASNLYWCGSSWYDDVGTVHETLIGARASITMDRRQQLTVTTPAIPTGTGGGAGTTSLVQKADNQSASTGALVVTLPGVTTLGNTVIVAVQNNGGFVTSITGGGVTTWAFRKRSGVNEPTEIWSGLVDTTPSAAVTVNVVAASRVNAKAMEWTGALTVDVTNSASGSSVTPDPGSVTPTQANDLVVAAVGIFQPISAGPTGGFTNQGTNNGTSGSFGLGVGTLVETSIVAADPAWTATTGGWDGVIVAFKVPAGASEDPDKVRVYLLPNATAPAPGAFWLQATDALTTRILTNYTGSGTHDGAGTAFPGGVGATLGSADMISWLLQGNGIVHMGGTTFPTSPANNDHFYRSDLHMGFYFDGTRWVSEQVFVLDIGGSGPAGSLAATTNSFGWAPMDYLGGTDAWLLDAVTTYFVNTGGTALGASHSWSATIAKQIDSAVTLTTVATMTLASGANGNRAVKVAINALAGAIDGFVASVAKVGTPGAIFLGVAIYYRVVAT